MAPSSAGSTSLRGTWVKPACLTVSANDAGAATRTSCPAAEQAETKGASGPKCPAPAVVAASTRTGVLHLFGRLPLRPAAAAARLALSSRQIKGLGFEPLGRVDWQASSQSQVLLSVLGYLLTR